jgi:hypothetical protein
MQLLASVDRTVSFSSTLWTSRLGYLERRKPFDLRRPALFMNDLLVFSADFGISQAVWKWHNAIDVFPRAIFSKHPGPRTIH